MKINISLVARCCLVALLVVGSGACLTANKLTEKETPVELKSGYEVKVVDVVKGDELVVEKQGKRAKLRLVGLFAFSETLDDPALEALKKPGVDFLRAQTIGKKVTLTIGVPEKDSYGRYLGHAALKGKDVAESLLEMGNAVVYTEYAFDREASYMQIEAAARTKGNGLWASEETAKIVKALRKQWHDFRLKRTGKPFVDMLSDTTAP